MKTHNENSRAAITSKFFGPTNSTGARIIVSSQRGRKSFSYPYEKSGANCHSWAVEQYLNAILKEDKKEYGENATGWGELSDYSIGQLKTGEYVFVSNI
jgi:hypothetical protein